MTPRVGPPTSPFQNIPVREMMESQSGLTFVNRLYFLCLHLAVKKKSP